MGPVGDMPVVSLAGVAHFELSAPRPPQATSWEARPLDLYEYQGKQFFARYGIPVSLGEAVTSVDEAVAAADRIGYPVVIKAQVQVGGRGKAGGIKLAHDADETRTHAGDILGMDIKGHTVEILWIERASDIAEEYYASFTLDRSAKKHLGMLSARGGVDIEAVAAEDPDAIAKIWVDPVDGLTEEQAKAWVAAAQLNPDANDGVVHVLLQLYNAYVEGDADLVEINPLILLTGGPRTGEVHALDAKVTLDGNSVFRHPDYEAYDATQVRDERGAGRADKGLQYVGFNGYVGMIANGAGLAIRPRRRLPGRRRAGQLPRHRRRGLADVMAGPSRSSTTIQASARSSSTSSAVSPRARRWPTASSRPSAGSHRPPILIRLDGTNADQGRGSSSPTCPTSWRSGRMVEAAGRRRAGGRGRK